MLKLIFGVLYALCSFVQILLSGYVAVMMIYFSSDHFKAKNDKDDAYAETALISVILFAVIIFSAGFGGLYRWAADREARRELDDYFQQVNARLDEALERLPPVSNGEHASQYQASGECGECGIYPQCDD